MQIEGFFNFVLGITIMFVIVEIAVPFFFIPAIVLGPPFLAPSPSFPLLCLRAAKCSVS